MKPSAHPSSPRRVVSFFLLLTASCLLAFIFTRTSASYAASQERRAQKASATQAAAISTPSRAAGNGCSAIAFGHSTIVDFSATSGEPFINSAPIAIAPNTPAGAPFVSVPFGLSTTVSILWKSIDGGRTFIQLGSPITRDAVPAPGGGDTHQDFDALGRFYYNDLSAACVTTAVSDDGGNTFPKVSALACVGPNDIGGLTDDRQWSGGFGDGRGYMTVRNLAASLGGNFHLARTRDAGITWNLFNQQIGTVSQSGPLVVDKTKRNIGGTNFILAYQIYHTGGTALKMLRIKDDDSGAPTVAVDDLPIVTPGGSVATVFPVMAVGRDGSLYVTWSNGTQIQMVTSQNFGQTFSAPKVVSGLAAPAAKIMPWVIAGDAGRANIVWYQSTEGIGNALTNRWQIYMAQTLNALDATPTYETTTVSEHTVHFGEICLAGLSCDTAVPPGSRDRSFLEFPSITLDDRGAAMIIWNDNTNQSAVTAAAPQVTGAPYVMFAKQVRGPSLFASVGNVDQGPGTVAITQPTNGQQVTTAPLNVAGTHTLPPGTFDNDEAGDARFPDHGPTIGANVPALDIRKVTMTDNATTLTVKMEVADLTTAALAAAAPATGGDGLLYLTQWDYDESASEAIDRVFWVAAEVRGGVPVARTGTLGVIRSSTSKKFITYNPVLQDSLQATVAITNGAPGTITITIPRNLVGTPPDGALLKTVSGYAMSERGALTPCPDNTPAACENVFTPTSLPLKVDASGAFTYVVAQGPRFDGTVEFSLDDPAFANPRPATVDAANQNWQGQLSSTDLTPGNHILYARQTINCNSASPIASVAFVVPGGGEPIVVSRKMHGGTVPFDIPLPLTGNRGIECRRDIADSDHFTVVFTFPTDLPAVNPVDGVAVSGQKGTPSVRSSTRGPLNNQFTVELQGVVDAQTVNVTLNGVHATGGDIPTVQAPMGVLHGDVNGDVTPAGLVSNADVASVKAQVGAGIAESNFRNDVNANGTLSNGDVGDTKTQVGTRLP